MDEPAQMRCPSCQGAAFNKETLRAGDAVFEIFICRACGKRVTRAKGVAAKLRA
ncbi:MAG: hypothetical protein V1735_06265 [Nanoarchaeota archaeon]